MRSITMYVYIITHIDGMLWIDIDRVAGESTHSLYQYHININPYSQRLIG